MKRGYKYLVWAIGGIWVVAMLALSPKFVSLHRETKIVEQLFAEFTAALVSQDYSKAYQFCGPDFQAVTSLDQFIKVQQSLRTEYGNLKSVKQAGYNVENRGTPAYWSATFNADFEYQTRTLRFQITLHKENGHWVIFSYQQI